MTIEEALEEARQTKACWIVWNTDTGEILSVTGTDPNASPEDRFADLRRLSDFKVPVKARHVASRDVTRQFLVAEQRDTDRVRTRGDVLIAWSSAPVEALLQVLERGEYQPPMRKDFDSTIIVDHLWEAHRDELAGDIRRRLQALVAERALCSSASRNLEAYLLALAGDEASLRAIWRGERSGRTCYADAFVLMDCFAHVQISDHEIINDMITLVEEPGLFGPRWEAMMALGRLGAVAGIHAATAIRKGIYDSGPQVAAQRDRVLQRIETVNAEWVRCGTCCYGRVHEAGNHGTTTCPECGGMGFLLREQTPSMTPDA